MRYLHLALIYLISMCIMPASVYALECLPEEEKQIEEGHFPERLLEELRIVQLDQTSQQYVQSFFENLQRAKAPSLNHKKIAYMIADLDYENAFAITGENMNWVVFTRPLLKKLKFEDVLMWVLPHELYHVLKAAKGTRGRATRNTKAEEGLADLFAFKTAHEGGYDLRTIESFMKDFFASYFATHGKAGSRSDFAILVDAHIKPENRLDGLEKVMGSYDFAEGGLKAKPRPMDASLANIIEIMPHHSFMDSVLVSYTPPMERLLQGIRSLKPHHDQRTKDYIKRLEIIHRSNLVFDGYTLTKDDLATISDAILDLTKPPTNADDLPYLQQIQVEILESLNKEGILEGRMAVIRDLARDLIDAKDEASAKNLANAFFSHLRHENLDARSFRKFTWPKFPEPKVPEDRDPRILNGTLVPWNQLVLWALNDKTKELRNTLLILGLEDPRLLDTLTIDELAAYTAGNLSPISRQFLNERNSMPLYGVTSDGTMFPDREFAMAKRRKRLSDEDRDYLQNLRDKPIYQRLAKGLDYFNSETMTNPLGHFSSIFMHLARPRARSVPLALSSSDIEDFSFVFRFELRGNVDTSGWHFDLLSSANIRQFLTLHFGDLFTGTKEEMLDVTAPLYDRQRLLIETIKKIYARDKAEGAAIYKILYDVYTKSLAEFRVDAPLNAPLIELSWELPSSILENADKVALLNAGLSNMTEQTLGRRRPQVGNENFFLAVIDMFNEKIPRNPREFADFITRLDKLNRPFTAKALPFLSEYFANNVADFGFDEVCLILDLIDKEFNYYFPEAWEIYQEIIMDKSLWPNDLQSLIRIWRVLRKFALLKTIESFEFGDDLIKRLEKDPKSQGQNRTLLEDFMTSPLMEDPKARDLILALWTDSVFKELGPDPGNDLYMTNLAAVAEPLREKLSYRDKLDFFSKLASRIKARERATLYLKSLTEVRDRRDLQGSLLLGVFSESALEQVQIHHYFRREILRFLVKPLSDASRDQFMDVIESLSYISFLGEDLRGEKRRHYVGDASHWLDYLPMTKQGLTRNERRIYVDLLHNNFSALSLEPRALVVNKLLFPPSSLAIKDEFDKSWRMLMDVLFPSHIRFHAEAELILSVYLNTLDEHLRNLFLSAVIAASQDVQRSSRELTIGDRLALVLEKMGPAEIKFGQGLDSHPSTDPEFKGTKRLKSNADPLVWWAIYDLMNNNLPEEIRSQIEGIEEAKGFASIDIVVAVKTKPGSELRRKYGATLALSLERPFAYERAQRGLERMTALVEELQRESSVPLPFDTLLGIIGHTRETIEDEIKSSLRAIKNQAMADAYDRYKITIDDQEFSVEAVKLILNGKGWRLMNLADGVHFNDLPETTSEEQIFKRRAAIAHLVPYLAVILKGAAFDYDRHGEQSRVEIDAMKPLLEQPITVHLFDPGGMQLESPDPEAFALLVSLIDEAFAQSLPRNEVMTYMTTRVLELAEQYPMHNHYLQGVQKGILSLGDFFEVLTESDYKKLFETLYQHNLLHPDIKTVLKRRFFTASAVFNRLTSAIKGCEDSFNVKVSRD